MHMAAEKGHTSTVEFLADKFRASVFDRTKVKTIKQWWSTVKQVKTNYNDGQGEKGKKWN